MEVFQQRSGIPYGLMPAKAQFLPQKQKVKSSGKQNSVTVEKKFGPLSTSYVYYCKSRGSNGAFHFQEPLPKAVSNPIRRM